MRRNALLFYGDVIQYMRNTCPSFSSLYLRYCMRLLLFASFAWLFFSCNSSKDNPPGIIVTGNVSGVPDGYVYLAEAGKWKTPLDSAWCSNGKFVFRIRTDSLFVPYEAAIYYRVNNDISKPVRLQFRNHQLADSLHSLRDVYWLEQGTTFIEGNNSTSPWLRIRAGRETELLYQNQFTDIGWMGYKDTTTRKTKLDTLHRVLQQNSYSFFLLKEIDDAKETYSKEELVSLLAMFDKTVQRSAPGKKFAAYLSLRPGAGMPYPPMQMKATDGKYHPVIDTTAKLNMLVFWASWCSPCIKEIPQLKELHRRFDDKGLHIVSISIDEDPGNWRKGLSLHPMNWSQLLVEKDKIEEIQHIFSFTTIPFLVFTDSTGKELARFADYDPDNTGRYEAFIQKQLRP